MSMNEMETRNVNGNEKNFKWEQKLKAPGTDGIVIECQNVCRIDNAEVVSFVKQNFTNWFQTNWFHGS